MGFKECMVEFERAARAERSKNLNTAYTVQAESPEELLEKPMDTWAESLLKVLPDYVVKELREGKDNQEALKFLDKLFSVLDVPAEHAQSYKSKILDLVGGDKIKDAQ